MYLNLTIYTAKVNKVARSLHLHHVPQAPMLECKLEILLSVPYSNKTCTLNMQPQRGQYNDVLAKDTYLVAVVRSLST
jgi:hypothetical protein